MALNNETNICHENAMTDQSDRKDLVSNLQMENPTDMEMEQGFNVINSIPSIRTIANNFNEKLANKSFLIKNSFNITICVALITLLILVLVTVIENGSDQLTIPKKSLKCKICGEGVEFATILGDMYGNICNEDSLEKSNYECGVESACFTMEVSHSRLMSKYIERMKAYYQFIGHPNVDDPLLHEGTVKGCMKGFNYGERCHSYNMSDLGYHSSLYWTATETCSCTQDNCN